MLPVAGLVGVDGLLLVHDDGRVGFSREARKAGTHTPLCVVAISGAVLRGTFHWPILGRPSKHVPTLVLSLPRHSAQAEGFGRTARVMAALRRRRTVWISCFHLC